MSTLCIDVETTGLPCFGQAATRPDQPHICEIAVVSEDGTTALNVLIKPEGWTIPMSATAIHQITQEMAMAEGIPIKEALAVLAEECSRATRWVAHNGSFEFFMLKIECERAQVKHPLKGMKLVDTMHEMTPICNLDGEFGNPRWPKLTDAYRHVMGCELEDAHTALTDAQACWAVWTWLQAYTAASTEVLPTPLNNRRLRKCPPPKAS